MSKSKKLTGNLFDNKNITASRFLDFCMFVYEAMTASNKDGKYDKFLLQLQAVIDAVEQEINDVDTGLSSQVNSTSDVDQFIYNFGQFMKNNSGALAYALGGNTTTAYYQFYPYKNEEYRRATRKTMPMLAGRVMNLATQYADSLGQPLTGDLQGFLPGYKKLLSAQRQQITNVKQNRITRNDAFAQGQWTLTGIVHDVASLNLSNPQETEKLFPFAMLYPQNKNRGLSISGNLAASESKELLNRLLTDKVTVTVQNTGVNAAVLLWLAASPKDEIAASPITVQANSTATLKAGDLGDLSNPFLMTANYSNINEAAFIITIKGLKKNPDTSDKKTAGKNEKLKIA